MKVVVTYDIENVRQRSFGKSGELDPAVVREQTAGPISTGAEAINNHLAMKGVPLRLHINNVMIEG